MLKLCRVTKVKVLFPVLVYVFNFNLFEFSAAILEKGLFHPNLTCMYSHFLTSVNVFSFSELFHLLENLLFCE